MTIHTCPRCKQPGIGGFAKRWSSRAAPAECKACGGLSHVLASTTSGIWAVGVLILVVSLIGGLGLHSALFFCSGLVLAVACNVRAWRRAAMYPISTESAASASHANWWVAGIYAFIAILQ
ncbi:hypothetical protein ACSFBM_13290 [Variovorax sp. GB1R11]|uniref:hypothetical protein n=1 Tax=Variovorax sp. GB1R11 TaxID=3443741 RepID=UPI003F48C127